IAQVLRADLRADARGAPREFLALRAALELELVDVHHALVDHPHDHTAGQLKVSDSSSLSCCSRCFTRAHSPGIMSRLIITDRWITRCIICGVSSCRRFETGDS